MSNPILDENIPAQLNEVDFLEPNLEGSELRIAIVQARFNENICRELTSSCVKELVRLGVSTDDILLTTVPGALEIPLALQKLAESSEFDALIALGAVIRGETYHFELVANESGAAITRVGLDLGIPIANGILTCDTDEQALARVVQKGADCALAAVEMANFCLIIQEGEDA
ncbi:6,7-dimethyl-8-ribityllumazine synthase [Polynucleobacter kasalickyi]|uniref:6,7-dimethyl-8-ribityllumazine synthase n=1 Tax=Polynucleobacter kasalickyi TaxID=1938817 RepID=A0A1W1Y1U2_9BURK|nr:6,7-dimethyl-8-ribityllumazine synthase [Polynucleobacter kasalickyi]SMC30107.1 6,7-dimethyl-8-ribityllumazine synthase [Polynucleobacter kasalickyi]